MLYEFQITKSIARKCRIGLLRYLKIFTSQSRYLRNKQNFKSNWNIIAQSVFDIIEINLLEIISKKSYITGMQN